MGNATFMLIIIVREYSTYRVHSTYIVHTSRLKAQRARPLVVHDNLKTFTNYCERSVQNL